MKALVNRKYGSLNNLTIEEVPTPNIKSDEVLVKVKAVSINDWDLGMIKGSPFVNRMQAGLFKPKLQILGSDVAGVVMTVGSDVTKFRIGDCVYGDLSNNQFGGFAELIATSEKHLCHMAESMPFDIAAAIPQAGMLAYQALYDFGEIRDGMRILINGAGGGVGTYAVQMLRDLNVHLTGIDAEVKREMLLSLGYDAFMDYKKVDFTKQADRYDLIIDCKTNKPLSKYAEVLNDNGMYITIGGDMLKVIRILLGSKSLEKKYGRKYNCVQLSTNRNLPEINQLYEEGKLTSIIDLRRFTLLSGREAMTYYASGEHLGKVLIVIEE